MRYLIVGCGRVGSALAKLLDADGHEVIVVDENPAAFKRLGPKFKGHEVVGTGIDYDVLKRAGAATADGFIAVTNGDNRNIMAALDRAAHVQDQAHRRAHLRSAARPNVSRARRADRLPHDRGRKLIRDVLIEAPWETANVRSRQALVDLGHRQAADAGKRVGEIEEAGKIRIAAVRRGDRDVMVASDDLVLARGRRAERRRRARGDLRLRRAIPRNRGTRPKVSA